MAFLIRKSLDMDFAHHVRGHSGHCINIHGHTWKFEVALSADTLDKEGFVADFKKLKVEVLQPCHDILDHSLAVGDTTWNDIKGNITEAGKMLIQSRKDVHGTTDTEKDKPFFENLNGARNEYPGGIKVSIFPFTPTSERLAEWLFHLAKQKMADDRIRVEYSRVYECLHPVESMAQYRE